MISDGTSHGITLGPETQKWTRWVVGVVVAIVVAWFGIEARVKVLEARIIRLESQVDRMDNKVDQLLYRSLYSTLTPLPNFDDDR